MIFPFLKGFLSLKKAPVTWILFGLNLMVFMLSYTPEMLSQYKLEDQIKDDFFIKSQGRIYAQFISENSQFYSPLLKQMARRVQEGDPEKLEWLGSLALRNDKFVREAPTTEFKGDQVAISHWRRSIASIDTLKATHPSYMLGLNSEDTSEWKWLSYIFIHSGMMHLLGNMLFMLIFAGVLESVVGGLGVLILFLISGAFAAGFYLLVSGASAAPLVGASGAVSGLMAFFCFLYWNKPVRFVYWLFLPLKAYSGFIYLPGWIIFVMWMAADLAGYISTLDELGGVAYTAHLGGELIGLCAGIILTVIRRQYAGKNVPTDNQPMGKRIPFEQMLSFKSQP